MHFASDNAGPVHPRIMTALNDANTGYAQPYGGDASMDRARARIRDLFEAPDAAVYLVATGTAANSLALATLTKPWQTVFCTPVAHIQVDECNAPEFYMGGAKLTPVPGADRMTPQALRAAVERTAQGDVHVAQRGPVSITQITERGTVYSLAELTALSAVADDDDLPVHMDGARFANALAALGCTPAEMTWKLGVDAVSFGGTKNGCMGVEAVIFFDPDKAWEFELRRKRGAHLVSKHRYLSAQMLAYLSDALWLETARTANAKGARLAAGLKAKGARLLFEPQANIIFTAFPRAIHQRLHHAGAEYEISDGDLEGDDPHQMLTARLVCDWSLRDEDIDRFLDLF
jgi:threonine aldolase